MNKFSGSYYAEGSIIRDEFVFGAEGWVAPFVDVLYVIIQICFKMLYSISNY